MKISSRWSWIMPKTLHFEICWTWWEPCFIKAFILQCDTEDIQEVLRDHLSALYFFPYEHFPITCAHFSITLSHPNIQGHPERMRKVKRSPWTLNLGPMKTVLLFFFLDDDDPVLQVGLELRDYESESGRKQSFSYDVSWTQLRSDIALWCKFKHLKQCHCLQIWYACSSLKTYFEKKFWGKYNCQKRRVLNMYYSQYTLPYSAQIPREGKGEASTQYLYSLHWHLSIPAV